MKQSLLKTSKGGGMLRVRLILVMVGAALAVSAVTASSASALQWWLENPGHPSEPVELKLGEQLPINETAKVHSPFTFKWLHHFEVKCKGASYRNLYLEGTASLGAEKFVFENCAVKKPKKGTLVGGAIETAAVHGEIGGPSPVTFDLAPTGGVLTSFTIKGTVKPHHHGKRFHSRECTYSVSAEGNLSGDLGDAEAIGTEKTFEFDSTGLVFKQTKSCVPAPAVSPVRRNRSASRPLTKSALVLKTAAGKLPTGAPLLAVSTNLIISTPPGNLECTATELVGTLNDNGSSSISVALQSPMRFSGEEPGGLCRTTGGLGPVEVEQAGNPWHMELTGTGKADLESKPSAMKATFPSLGGKQCLFGPVAPGRAFIGTSNTSGPVTIKFTHVKVEGEATGGCASEGEMNGEFTLTSGGERVEAEVSAGGGKEAKEEEEEQEEQAEEAQETQEEEEGQAVEGNKGKVGYSAIRGWGVL
jgi:hypothetical protein